MLEILLHQIDDHLVRDNFRKIVEFINGQVVGAGGYQLCELFVTANQTGIKIKHGLVQVPKDAIITRLIAPSAARLVIDFAEFTSSEVSFDVSGLAAGETLHARVLVGTFENAVTIGTNTGIENPTQQARSKF